MTWAQVIYVIVEALPRVCMKNTARGECRMVDTAQSRVLHLPQDTPRVLCFIHTSI